MTPILIALENLEAAQKAGKMDGSVPIVSNPTHASVRLKLVIGPFDWSSTFVSVLQLQVNGSC